MSERGQHAACDPNVRTCARALLSAGCGDPRAVAARAIPEQSRKRVRLIPVRPHRAAPPEAVAEAASGLWDALVDAVAARVLAELPLHALSEWLDVAGAAAHLACSKHRLYRLVSMRRIPHHHEGARLL